MPGSHGLTSNHAPHTFLCVFPFPSNHRQTVMNISLHLSLNLAFLPTTASLPNPPLQTHHPPPSKSPTPTHKTPLLSKQHPTYLSSPPPQSTNPHPPPHTNSSTPFPKAKPTPPTPTPASKTPHQTFNTPATATPSIASMKLQPGPRRRNRYVAGGIAGEFFPDTAPTVPDGAGMICEVARARSERPRWRDRGQRAYARSSPGRRSQTANYYDPLIRTKEMEKSNFEAVLYMCWFFLGRMGAELMERRKFIGSGFWRWTGWVFEGLRFFGYI